MMTNLIGQRVRVEYLRVLDTPAVYEEQWPVAFSGFVQGVAATQLIVHITEIDPEFIDRKWLGYIRLMYGRLIAVDLNHAKYRVSASELRT